MFQRRNLISAIEIGTSKICFLMGEADEDGNMVVLGHGEIPSGGAVLKGEAIDFENVVSLLSEAIDIAVKSAAMEIVQNNLFISVTGAHVGSQRGVGSVNITDDGKVKEHHVVNAIKNAQNIALRHDKAIINTLETSFILDGDSNRRFANPLNHIAHKIDAVVHIIYGDINRVETFKALLRETGFDMDPVPVFSGVAAAYGIMKKIEIENGALLIDMGAGTTEYVLTHNSGVLHSGVLTVGGEHLVNDLSLGLDLAQNVCRKILNEGEYLAHRERGDTFISIDGLIDQNTRKIPLNSFDKIIDLRLKETFSIIKREITDRQMLSKINTGLIFTGGVAELPQAREILQSVFEMPARIGKPEDISGAVTDLENPRYSTIWGLLKYGDRIRQGNETGGKTNFIDLLDNFSSNVLNKFSSILKSIKF